MALPETCYGISLGDNIITFTPIYTQFGLETSKRFDQFRLDKETMMLLHKEKAIPLKSTSKTYRYSFDDFTDIVQYIKILPKKETAPVA